MGRPEQVAVWVEAGREGRLLSYGTATCPDLQPGDLVRVRLRGRLLNGLVTAETPELPEGLKLEPVLERLEAAAVDPRWQALLQAVAVQCHTAPFQVLKTALPHGWLGQKAKGVGLGRKQLVAVASGNPALPSPSALNSKSCWSIYKPMAP